MKNNAENVIDNTPDKYDPGEWIYRDIDASGTVTNNDIRLTAVTIGTTTYPAGSTVSSGYALTNFCSN